MNKKYIRATSKTEVGLLVALAAIICIAAGWGAVRAGQEAATREHGWREREAGELERQVNQACGVIANTEHARFTAAQWEMLQRACPRQEGPVRQATITEIINAMCPQVCRSVCDE